MASYVKDSLFLFKEWYSLVMWLSGEWAHEIVIPIKMKVIFSDSRIRKIKERKKKIKDGEIMKERGDRDRMGKGKQIRHWRKEF